MEQLVARGLVKSIGVSNFGARRLQQLLSFATIPPVANQIELHPYLQQNELVQFCKRHNIIVIAYSPLGSPGRDAKPAGEPVLLEETAVSEAAATASASTYSDSNSTGDGKVILPPTSPYLFSRDQIALRTPIPL